MVRPRLALAPAAAPERVPRRVRLRPLHKPIIARIAHDQLPVVHADRHAQASVAVAFRDGAAVHGGHARERVVVLVGHLVHDFRPRARPAGQQRRPQVKPLSAASLSVAMFARQTEQTVVAGCIRWPRACLGARRVAAGHAFNQRHVLSPAGFCKLIGASQKRAAERTQSLLWAIPV